MTNPKYPIYIPSKWRWESRLTSKALEMMWVPYNIVVEEHEYEQYKKACKGWNVIILDKKYQEEYDAWDDLWMTKSKWSWPARNFIRDHSIKAWYKRHWIMDDNIRYFSRMNNNLQVPVWSWVFFKCMEDFCERYENVAMAWPQYDMFVPQKQPKKPFTLNTRLFSCNLIRNDIPFRRRLRYNEDIDLSIRILRDWRCTIQFNAFLQGNTTTQLMTWGNTDEVYKNWTLAKSRMLADKHPDIVQVVQRYWRWYHTADLSKFKHHKLRKKKNIKVKKGIDNYWMELKKIK